MNVDYINPFIVASSSVLTAMLGLDITMDKPKIAPITFTDGALVILIGITGEVKGQVFLGFSRLVACKVASLMIGSEVTELNTLSESALSELGNMIMGNTATLFSQSKQRIDITPPTVAKGNMLFDTKEMSHILIPIRLNDTMTIDLHVALKK